VIDIAAYIYIWENYRLFELPWDSVWTWIFTLLAVDFGYYWLHRCAHGMCVGYSTLCIGYSVWVGYSMLFDGYNV